MWTLGRHLRIEWVGGDPLLASVQPTTTRSLDFDTPRRLGYSIGAHWTDGRSSYLFFSDRKSRPMSSKSFHEPIVVENLLDRLVSPNRKKEQTAESYDQRMNEGFNELRRVLYKLGASQGIHDPDIWRATTLSIFEEHFGKPVEQREIAGELCDVIVHEEGHVLFEIVSSAGAVACERILRKRKNYTEFVGVAPSRVIVATPLIHSKRSAELKAEGIEIPLIDDDYNFEPCN